LPNLWKAEHAHDGVADVLLNSSAMSFKDCPHAVEVSGQDPAQELTIELLSQRRRADQVRENNRDGLALHSLRLPRSDRPVALAGSPGSVAWGPLRSSPEPARCCLQIRHGTDGL